MGYTTAGGWTPDGTELYIDTMVESEGDSALATTADSGIGVFCDFHHGGMFHAMSLLFEERLGARLGAIAMRHFLINPTWRCQNACSYCWVQQTVRVRPELMNAPRTARTMSS